MKKIVFLSVIFFLFGWFLFPNKQQMDLVNNPVNIQKQENAVLDRNSNLIKNKSEKVEMRVRSIGSYSGKKKMSKTENTWYENWENLENSLWQKQNVTQLKGIFATHQLLPNRKMIRKIDGRYLYNAESGEIENVFVDKKSNKILFWSGELVLEAEQDISNLLEDLQSIQVVKFIGPHILIKINFELDYHKDLETISNAASLKNVELDLSSQRRKKI